MMALAILIGGGSLLLFGVFLIIGPITIVRFCASERQVLLWDGLLSLLFFIQHRFSRTFNRHSHIRSLPEDQ